MKKTILLILSALLIVGAVGGCSAKKAETTKNAVKVDKSPITFTVFIADTVMQNRWQADNMQSPISKKITKDTGVTLKIEFPVGDIQQRISLMVASGDYPDLLYAGTETNTVVDAGGFVKLDNLIQKYGPNIKNLYGDYMSRLKYSPQDPSIYYLGRDGVRNEQTAPTGGIEIMNAAVKEAGFPQIKTLTDVENVIKQYVQKHPTINGGPTIGFSMIGGDQLQSIFTLFNAAGNVAGLPNDGDWDINQTTYKGTYKYQMPEVKDYFKWLNHLNATGLLDPESFTQKNDQYQTKVAAGRIVAMGDDTWQYAASSRAAKKTYGAQVGYGIYPVTVNDKVKNANFMSSGYAAVPGIGITTKCKDPVRAIKFLDYLSSDENQVAIHWGIAGNQYTIVNGKRTISAATWTQRFNDQDWSNKQGLGSWGYPWPDRGTGEKDSSGQLFDPVTPAISAQNYTAPEKEVLSKYNAKLWMDLFPAAKNFNARPYGDIDSFNFASGSDLQVLQTNLDAITFKRAAQMIIAKPADFDSIYAAYINELKQNGLVKMEGDFNTFLAEKIKFWKK